MLFDSPRHPDDIRGSYELRAADVFRAGTQDSDSIFALPGIPDPVADMGGLSAPSQQATVGPYGGPQYPAHFGPIPPSTQAAHFGPMTSSEISDLVSSDGLFTGTSPQKPSYNGTSLMTSTSTTTANRGQGNRLLHSGQRESSSCNEGTTYTGVPLVGRASRATNKRSKSNVSNRSKKAKNSIGDSKTKASESKMPYYRPGPPSRHHVMPSLSGNSQAMPAPPQHMPSQQGHPQQQVSTNRRDVGLAFRNENEAQVGCDSAHQTGSNVNGSMMNDCASIATSPPMNRNMLQRRREQDSKRWIHPVYSSQAYNYACGNDYMGEENLHFPSGGQGGETGSKSLRVQQSPILPLSQSNYPSGPYVSCSGDKETHSRKDKSRSKRAPVRALGVSALLPVPLQLNHSEVIEMWGKGRNILTEYDPNEMSSDSTLDHAAILEKFDAAAGLVPPSTSRRRSQRERAQSQELENQMERRARSMRYREKRRNRKAGPNITRYEIRKIMALARPRVKGRFVKRIDM
mmetsp:Transcript_5627/g.20481  ORF Transcript_5627/g.20481 Transcript_5627/m.20481 type:complete len:516 (-) Transcript_5627:2105-3652(-)|eukprot:scaffold930_cov408-Prasinococcus_capsulatus_cf.AAC.9